MNELNFLHHTVNNIIRIKFKYNKDLLRCVLRASTKSIFKLFTRPPTFSIFYYFRLVLLTSVKKLTASPQVTDTLPLIIFMTGTDTHQHFIYHRSHHIHPWLKKTGTCLLKASNILLYYFVSIKSLLSTTLPTKDLI